MLPEIAIAGEDASVEERLERIVSPASYAKVSKLRREHRLEVGWFDSTEKRVAIEDGGFDGLGFTEVVRNDILRSRGRRFSKWLRLWEGFCPSI